MKPIIEMKELGLGGEYISLELKASDKTWHKSTDSGTVAQWKLDKVEAVIDYALKEIAALLLHD